MGSQARNGEEKQSYLLGENVHKTILWELKPYTDPEDEGGALSHREAAALVAS